MRLCMISLICFNLETEKVGDNVFLKKTVFTKKSKKNREQIFYLILFHWFPDA